ncbi:histidine kinase [Isoptericola sediminis]|uniref:histidine kinase n=1 Tax=Isoptericola sediminis TaxID=2733572 RepID=A0A849KDG6_9MICO|nr:hypothetical protein [Isoptericola sediminis]
MPALPVPGGVVDVDDATVAPAPRPAPWLVDVAAALGTMLVLTGAVLVGRHAGLLGVLAAVGFGLLVLLRRPAPVLMVVLTSVGVLVCAAEGLGALGTPLAAVTALCAATAQGHERWAAGAGAALVVAAPALGPPGTGLASDSLVELVLGAALVTAAVCLGLLLRWRRTAQSAAPSAVAGAGTLGPDEPPTPAAPSTATAPSALHPPEAPEAPDGPEDDARHRRQQELLRVALDLQEVVGHNLSLVALHTDVAAGAMGRDDDAAGTALRHVREATSATVHELRATTLLLRGALDPARAGHDADTAAREHLPAATGPAGLAALVQPVLAAGVDVSTRVDVPRGSIDAMVDAAAFRIVQEVLRDVRDATGGRRVQVRLVVAAGRLRIVVADDGRSLASGFGEDPGLAAVRHRAALLGGTLDVGSGTDGGLVVTAELPARLGE